MRPAAGAETRPGVRWQDEASDPPGTQRLTDYASSGSKVATRGAGSSTTGQRWPAGGLSGDERCRVRPIYGTDKSHRTAAQPISGCSNRNVVLALVFSFASQAGRGVWSFSTLSNYLRVVGGSVFWVGVAEGIQGLAQALVALLAGWYTDSLRRDLVLQVAGGLGVLTVAGFLLVLLIPGWDFHNPGDPVWDWMDNSVRYRMMVVLLGMWGSYQGIWNTALETIYADSVPTGQRSKYNTTKFILLQISSIVGPLVAIILFLYTGNNWGQHTLTIVFAGGTICCLPSICCLFFFSDRLAVDGAASSPSDTDAGESVSGEGDSLSTPLLVAQESAGTGSNNDGHEVSTDSNSRRSDRRGRCCVSDAYVPHIIVLSDLISGFGSGMTIKFWPVFFGQSIGLSPVSTNLIYVAVPLFMTLTSFYAQKISARFGRVQTSVGFAYLGALALAILACFGWVASDDWDDVPLSAVLPLYFLSTVQHCVRPLKKSILMDFVPFERRGRWNSLDSVTRFGWSGSAMIGGWLITQLGYGTLFVVTVVFQMVAGSLLWTLIDSVPVLEGAPVPGESDAVRGQDRGNAAGKARTMPAAQPDSTTDVNASANWQQMSRSWHSHENRASWSAAPVVVNGSNRGSGSSTTITVVESRRGATSSFFNGTDVRSHSHSPPARRAWSVRSRGWEQQQDAMTSSVHEALSDMQSPLLNSYARSGVMLRSRSRAREGVPDRNSCTLQ